MNTTTKYDILASAGKAKCPICGAVFPGRYPEGSVAQGMILKCKRCSNELEVNITGSGPRSSI